MDGEQSAEPTELSRRAGSYTLRFRFLLSEGARLGVDERVIDLELPGCGLAVTLQPAKADAPISEETNLVILGGASRSEEEARDVGERLKQALLICSTKLRMGLDMGKDRSTLQWSKEIDEVARQHGHILRPDVHGLLVFQEDELPSSFFRATGRMASKRGRGVFLGELQAAFQSVSMRSLSSREMLALELYNSAHFEVSQRARFITLTVAVEAIIEQCPMPDDVIRLVEGFIEAVEGQYNGDYRASFLGRVNQLKQESIRQSGIRLLKEYVGGDASGAFDRFYGIRSDLLHSGQVAEGVDLSTEWAELDELSSQLLVAICTSCRISDKPGAE